MSNRLALAALAAACIVAAAGGGYLATRQAVPTPAAAQAAAPGASTVAASESAAPTAAPVQETEAIVGDTTKPSTSTPAKNAARRADAPERAAASAHDSRTPIARRSEASSSNSSAAQHSVGSPGGLSSTWPSSAAQQPSAPIAPSSPAAPETPIPHIDEHSAQESARPGEPEKPALDELVVARDSVIGLQLDNRISSETAKVEDRVEAHVSRDVKVGDRVAIPSGAHVIGSVTQVERGGKFKEQARLGIRFNTIVLGDGTRLPISTETIVRTGDAPGNSSAAKIGGGAVGGAILGAILGGAKGAAIGATAGAGAGTAAVTASDRSTVVLSPGTPLTPRILSPVTVAVERDRDREQQ